MVRSMCLALVLVFSAGGLVGAGDAPAAARADLNANAALHYWRAFASLPKLDEKQQEEIRKGCRTLPLDARVRQWVTASAGALRELHHGAALPNCAWAVSVPDGVEAVLIECQGARLLAGFACLAIRVHFAEGHPAAALDVAVDTLTLARHVALGGSFVAILVRTAMEGILIDALAAYLPGLDAATLQTLSKRLDKLPVGGGLADGMAFEEKAGLDWVIRKVKESGDNDQLLGLLEDLHRGEQVKDARHEAKRFLEACGGNGAGIVKLAEQARPSYNAWTKKLDLPTDQFETEWQQFEAKELAANPVLKLLFPQMNHCRKSEDRRRVRWALLKAAVAIQRDGPGAVKAQVDPFGDGPFEYAAFDGGYELRSKLKAGDQPVSLTVGQRKN